MAQELNFVVVEANTISELEKKVNDRMNFNYVITNTPMLIHTDSNGIRYIQTMVKKTK
jgi:hypothetical protein